MRGLLRKGATHWNMQVQTKENDSEQTPPRWRPPIQKTGLLLRLKDVPPCRINESVQKYMATQFAAGTVSRGNGLAKSCNSTKENKLTFPSRQPGTQMSLEAGRNVFLCLLADKGTAPTFLRRIFFLLILWNEERIPSLGEMLTKQI